MPRITRINAMIGNKTANIVQIIHAPASAVDTTGLPSPPVVAVDTARNATVLPCTTPLTLPPAIILNPHLRRGSESPRDELINKTPDNMAAGEAIVSSKLSLSLIHI